MNFLLDEAAFQLAAVRAPPACIEVVDDHLDHHHHVAGASGYGLAPAAGHNAAAQVAQWQDPHSHRHAADPSMPEPDFDLIEASFAENFPKASDPTSFLRLARIPFVGRRSDGRQLRLLRVEFEQATDVGSVMPNVGGGTLRSDNPRLDVRLPGLEERSPERWVLTHGKAPEGWRSVASPEAIATMEGVQYLLIEGGAGAAAAFLAAGLVDRLLIYRAPIVIGGGLPGIGDIGLGALADAHGQWRMTDRRQLGSDTLEVYEKTDPVLSR